MELRFTSAFKMAYDSLVGTPHADPAGTVERDGKSKDESMPKNMAESAGASKQDKQPDKSKEDSKDADLKTFRTQCEKACLFELEGRLVPLVAK